MSDAIATPGLEPYMVLAQEMFRRVYADETPESLNTWAMAQLRRLAGERDRDALMMWEDSFTYYEELLAKREALAALPASERRELTWPWASWNHLMDPLEPGMLALIAAGDGQGKSIYAECLAEHWARQGRSVAFLHFELNPGIMFDRRAARNVGIDRRVLKKGELTPTQKTEITRVHDDMKSWPGRITYVHTPGWTVERALSQVQALATDDLCDVFIIDYLEKAAASGRQLKQYGSQLFEREADDVEQIKTFSEAAEIPALLLAQMNKGGKQASFGDLSKSNIRGSGAKTEKANVVVLLQRSRDDLRTVKVRLDKNTIGPVGAFDQWMEGERFRVFDLEEPVQDNETEPFDAPWQDDGMPAL